MVEPAGADLGGDDDEDDECEAAFPGDEEVLLEEDEFYADIMDSR
ncbi:hypothetical protein ABT187_46760 [Streptomyces sp. NPDC001817]